MKKTLAFLLHLTLAGSLAAGPISIVPEKQDGGRTLVMALQNNKSYPVTVTLEFPELRNLVSPEALPVTRTLQPNERLEALAFSVPDPSEPGVWNYRYQWTSGDPAAEPDLSYQYRLPYAQGSGFTVIQSYSGNFSHQGDDRYCVDWAMAEGTPVLAARGGLVMNVQGSHDGSGNREEFFDKANYVRVLHSDGTVGVYLHFRKDGVAVEEGQTVEEGSLIGYSGNTGFSSQPHLHFGVYRVVDGARQESLPVMFRTSTEAGLVLSRGRAYRY